MSTDTTETGNVIETVGSSVLEWVRVGLLPYIVVSVNSVIVLVGISLNLILIIMFKKWRLYKNPGTTLIIQLAVIDIIYCAFSLPLSSVAAILKSWHLPDIVCSVYGIVSTWLYNLQFGILALFAVDRLIILKNKTIYTKTFGSVTFFGIVCVLVYSLELLVSALPLVPSNVTGTITFNPQIFMCEVNREESHLILNMELVLCFVCPAVTYAACLTLIARVRSGIVPREQNSDSPRSNISDAKSTVTISLEGNDSQGIEENLGNDDLQENKASPSAAQRALSPSSISVQETSRNVDSKEPRILKKIQSAKDVVFNLLKDDKKDEDYHLAVSCFITWFLVSAVWSVRLVVTYVQVYGHVTVWNGVYIVATLIGNLSFCIKPIVYLSHNKNLKRQTKSVLPTVVRSTATKIHSTVSSAVDKLDGALFRTRTSVDMWEIQQRPDTVASLKRLDSDLTWPYKEMQDVEPSAPPTETILNHA